MGSFQSQEREINCSFVFWFQESVGGRQNILPTSVGERRSGFSEKITTLFLLNFKKRVG